MALAPLRRGASVLDVLDAQPADATTERRQQNLVAGYRRLMEHGVDVRRDTPHTVGEKLLTLIREIDDDVDRTLLAHALATLAPALPRPLQMRAAGVIGQMPVEDRFTYEARVLLASVMPDPDAAFEAAWELATHPTHPALSDEHRAELPTLWCAHAPVHLRTLERIRRALADVIRIEDAFMRYCRINDLLRDLPTQMQEVVLAAAPSLEEMLAYPQLTYRLIMILRLLDWEPKHRSQVLREAIALLPRCERDYRRLLERGLQRHLAAEGDDDLWAAYYAAHDASAFAERFGATVLIG